MNLAVPINQQLTVSTCEARLDKYLVEQLGISRSQIKKLLDDQKILVNNVIATKSGMELKPEDVISILDTTNQEQTISLEPIDLPIEIVYEDKDLMIVNKPSNLLVYPTGFNEKDTLAARIKHYFDEHKIKDFGDSLRPGIVHRLDKDTSGLLIVAKNQKTLDVLQQMMLNHKIVRKYYAIVHNCFDLKNNRIFKIETTIGRSMQNKFKMQVNSNKDAKPAITIVKVIDNLSNTNALVECELWTGRTHQIRVHMQYINHPIVNDKVYGIEKHPSEYGQYLYCHTVEFTHPTKKNKVVKIDLPMPSEFLMKLEEFNYEFKI